VRGRHNSRKLILIAFVVILIGISVWIWNYFRATPVISPIPSDKSQNKSSFFIFKKNPDDLKKKIKDAVGKNWKNYSVLVRDYNSDFVMAMSESEIFTGASVNKVPILAALYYLAQKGEVNLDQVVTLQADDIQDYGTGSIRYDPPGSNYSVKTLAKVMMQQSDNTAAFLLGHYIVGMDKVQSIIDSWGMTQTNMINNKTSNHDIELLFEKMFRGQVANSPLTAEMLGFLTDGEFNDRLPALLPNEAKVYHKIGTADGNLHDVGIVVSGKTEYYIGIFVNDFTNENETLKLEAQVSKIVYDFMK